MNWLVISRRVWSTDVRLLRQGPTRLEEEREAGARNGHTAAEAGNHSGRSSAQSKASAVGCAKADGDAAGNGGPSYSFDRHGGSASAVEVLPLEKKLLCCVGDLVLRRSLEENG